MPRPTVPDAVKALQLCEGRKQSAILELMRAFDVRYRVAEYLVEKAERSPS